LDGNYSIWQTEFAEIRANLQTKVHDAQYAVINNPNDLSGTTKIEYLYLPSIQKKEKLVIINSGIHGVEAPVGVFFQHEFLKSFSMIDRTRTAFLLIHVMNSYGAKNGRRFNQHNVDLNRNCFDADLAKAEGFPGLHLKNIFYQNLQDFFESEINEFDIIWRAKVRGQQADMVSALSGQYESPNGIYFGGKIVEFECETVQGLLKSYIRDFNKVVLIDIHTGLGDYGINQIMLQPWLDNAGEDLKIARMREITLAEKMFPKDECEGVCRLSIPGYKKDSKANSQVEKFITHGDFVQWIYEAFPEQRKTSLILAFTAEVGTTEDRYVIEALVNENYCFHNRELCGEDKYKEQVSRLRLMFNPSELKWQNQVHRATSQMIIAIQRFSHLE
jgi:hypothetical protein